MLSYPDYKEKTVVICFTNQDERFSFRNDNLIIKDKDEKIILQLTCYRIFALWIVGNVNITSGLLERSKKFAFSICMLSYNFKTYGQWSAATDGNFLLRRKQYNFNDTTIANKIVENKIHNQQMLLKSIRNKNPECKQAVELLGNYKTSALKANDLNSLIGLEGTASRVFFSAWFCDMNWQGRKPRAKRDRLNTLLDIGYTYLFNMIESMLNLYGFDLYLGVLHRCFYQRKSLVCDIVEPFRCIIDQQLKKSHNLKQIKEEDFIFDKGQYLLKYDKSKEYTAWILKSILDYKEDIFFYVQTYYRWFVKSKSPGEFPIFEIK